MKRPERTRGETLADNAWTKKAPSQMLRSNRWSYRRQCRCVLSSHSTGAASCFPVTNPSNLPPCSLHSRYRYADLNLPGKWPALFTRVRRQGFDGVSASVNAVGAAIPLFKELLEDHGFAYVASIENAPAVNSLSKWRECKDGRTGKCYYYNTVTSVAQWAAPDGWTAGQASNCRVTVSAAMEWLTTGLEIAKELGAALVTSHLSNGKSPPT